jgi:hypothetical protein
MDTEVSEFFGMENKHLFKHIHVLQSLLFKQLLKDKKLGSVFHNTPRRL